MAQVLRVGLVSDTHGLLRPEVVAALRDSDRIIHAGDVGGPEVLEELGRIAPVTAVRGNVDRGAWAEALPATVLVEPGIFVLHDLHELSADPAAAGYRAVVTGHSHQPSRGERDGVLYVNPGAAGPRRFRLPVSVARLEIRGSQWRVEWIDLLTGSKLAPKSYRDFSG